MTSINLSVGRSCFVRCRGCYNHFGKPNAHVPDDTIVAFLAAAKDFGFTQVTLCGGDPLSRDGVVGLTRAIAKLGMRINIDTVGTAFLEPSVTQFFGIKTVDRVDPLELAPLVEYIGIPMDGSSQEVASIFRSGRPGLFSETMQVLRLLTDARARVCINTVAHRQNLEDLPNIARIVAASSNVAKWQIFQYMPTGPLGYFSRHEFEVREDEFTAAVVQSQKAVSAVRSFEVEAKSASTRKRDYLLVDSGGVAWMPDETPGEWDPAADSGRDRVILGSIADFGAHARIFSTYWERRSEHQQFGMGSH